MTIEPCNPEVFKNGESIGLFDISKEEAEAKCAELSKVHGCLVDWHYIAGRVHILMLKKKPAMSDQMDDIAKQIEELSDQYRELYEAETGKSHPVVCIRNNESGTAFFMSDAFNAGLIANFVGIKFND